MSHKNHTLVFVSLVKKKIPINSIRSF